MSDVFNRNLCSSPALHQQRLREVFQTSTADWVQFISASLLISDKIKRVESVIPTVANKRNYLRPTVNTYLCSKTVACKKSTMSQLCPKLRPLLPKIQRPLVWNSVHRLSKNSSCCGSSKTLTSIQTELRQFIRTSGCHLSETRATKLRRQFIENSGGS